MSVRTAAHERFWKSTAIGYMEWHDGIGYDLDALREMTAEERDEVVGSLRAKPAGWRDVEVYRAVATPEAKSALRDALGSKSAETRLHAAASLHDLGEMTNLASFVAAELATVTIADGMVVALHSAGRVPCDQVRRALLRGARDRPEVAVHYAATLCFLSGVAKSSFDFSMRPFFLRFGPKSSEIDRRAAFGELCRMTGMSADDANGDWPSAPNLFAVRVTLSG
jgi:hypothetical protein